MKSLQKIIIFLLFCSVGTSWAARRPNVVVFPLKADGVSQQTANLVTERLTTELGRSGRVRILERNEIEKILATAGFNFDDITSEVDGIEMGKLLNAHKIITGSIILVGKRITMAANYLDVETSVREISAAKDLERTSEDRLIEIVPDLVAQILDRIPLEGNILDVELDTVTVDIGSETGIELGTLLTVEQIKEIRDPRTGEIRAVPNKIGTLRVVDFAGKEFSRCMVLTASQRITPGMQVSSKMESIAVQKFKARRKHAILKSMVFPGRGQIMNGQNRGWLYLAGAGGSLGMSIFSVMKFNEAKTDYNDLLDAYNANPSNSLYQELQTAYDDKAKWKDQIPVFAAIAGGIWVWSVVDAMIWGGGEIDEFAYSGNSGHGVFLSASPQRIGLSVRF